MTAEEWLNGNELSCNIFDKKYRNGSESLEEFFDRVSHGYEPVKELIRQKKFIFGGRILASRGVSGKKATYSNCYVIAPPEDNIESIFECSSKLARTYSYGGGCGIDISKLRPNGAEVHNASKTSSGPVSFMDMFSQITQTISQNGRRGALMISMDINHPDINEFINCKTDLSRVNYANISIRVNDEFMKAVEEDKDYTLRWPCDLVILEEACTSVNPEYNVLTPIYGNPDFSSNRELFGYVKKVKARELFKKLVKNNWDYAEPGILYWDRIQGYNLLDNTDFEYAGTNPCAEEPLPAGGSCLLGSINLSEFVLDPFSGIARVDFDALEQAVFVAVTGLNQVLIEGLELHPLDEQKETVRDWRQIGLGTMGLADMLIKLGVKYGSKESITVIHNVYHAIATSAIYQSLALAKMHGCYRKCDKEALVDSNFIKNLQLPTVILDEIRQFGLYNSQLLTCAPTGSIGTMLQVSTGVEPNFALSYTRRTVSLNSEETTYKVDAKIVEDYYGLTDSTDNLPDYFVTSADIKPIDRIKVQAELQKFIDASISSTINLPKEATVEDVYNIYLEAWKNGLKGVTVYRSGCKREGILTTEEKPEDIVSVRAPKRPKELEADLHLVKSRGKQFIVLVGLFNGRPYEIWAFEPNITIGVASHKGTITKKSKMHYMFESDYLKIHNLELANEDIEEKAATLYASMLLRHGVPIKYVVKTAKKVNDNITSFSSAMCRVLNKYVPTEVTGEKCPECEGELIRESGCIHCKECGWSRCE